ncbi:MAG: AIR synthase family protein [bacterium]|nr:AIR synthase family protein [bacterium]
MKNVKVEMPAIGKISPEVFDQIIYPHLGAPNKNIIIGPRNGVDTGIVRLGNGKVMALTTDPVFIVPQYGFKRAAWFAINILVSDAVTSGLQPVYFTVDLNLPLSMKTHEFTEMWSTMDKELKKHKISVITGHTAKYSGTDYPMVGGATVICLGDEEQYTGPEFVREGDEIIITKGPAIEAAGLFVASLPHVIEKEFGKAFLKEAENIFWQMTVIEDAMTAVSIGVRDNGVSLMHDATECGVWGGLFEIANTCGMGMQIEKSRITVNKQIIQVCEYFHIDPYSSISEGTLLLTCRSRKSGDIIRALDKKKISAAVIGRIMPKEYGIKIKEDKTEKDLVHPVVDPFWQAFDKALKNS